VRYRPGLGRSSMGAGNVLNPRASTSRVSGRLPRCGIKLGVKRPTQAKPFRFWALAVLGLFSFGCRPRPGQLVPRPVGPLNLSDARDYVLSLVNRDRAESGLPPVERDETCDRAGQRHVEDMTRHGFTAHWGTDGSVPEQRYTEAGGVHFSQENAACFFDGQTRKLDLDAAFDPVLLEKIESAFMAEVPPHDGHRKNILRAVHNRLGIGLAKPINIAQPCMAQEFVDAYGEFVELPKRARLGDSVVIAGEIAEPVQFGGVGVARIAPAAPLSATELHATSTYTTPEPYVLFFPPGFETPKPVTVNGSKFTITVPLEDHGRPGRYEVSVWGKYPGAGDALVMVSLRTITVTR
jgi:uncharacterized protein YkwD